MDDIGYYSEDGKWHSENPTNYKNWLSKNKNIRTVLKCKKWFPRRSTAQNSYAHYVYDFIGKHIGYTMLEVKGFYKIMFSVKETSELSTAEDEDFMFKIRTHALTELNIYVPLPNEVIYE